MEKAARWGCLRALRGEAGRCLPAVHHSPGRHGVQLQGWLAAPIPGATPITLLSLSQNAPFSAQSLPGGDPSCLPCPAGLDLGCAANKHGAGAWAG